MLEYYSYRHPDAKEQASHLVILLHGYGANGNNLISLTHDFHQIIPDAHFISPNAINPCESGFPDSYQWFSLYNYKMQRRSLEELALEIIEANQILSNFIDQNLKQLNLGYDKLFLMGFSQGAMMAMYQGMSLKEKIAGIISFSGRVITPEMTKNNINSRPNICLIHGEQDSVLPFEHFIQGKDLLTQHNIPFEAFAINNLDHAIDIHSIRHAQHFIKKMIS